MAYVQPLDMVSSFRYLGRILTTTDDYWPKVIGNIQKSQRIWARLLRILGLEGADVWTLGSLYLANVQAVLIFVSETWVVIPQIGRILEGLHHQVAQRMAGKR